MPVSWINCVRLSPEKPRFPANVINQMKEYPRNASGMAVVRTVVSLLGLYDPESEEMSLEAAPTQSIAPHGANHGDVRGLGADHAE